MAAYSSKCSTRLAQTREQLLAASLRLARAADARRARGQ
jgi:hypothetical protein